MKMDNLDPYDHESLANSFGIANAMACELFWINDEAASWKEAPEKRFLRVREWAIENLNTDAAAAKGGE